MFDEEDDQAASAGFTLDNTIDREYVSRLKQLEKKQL